MTPACTSCHQPFDGPSCPRCYGETALPVDVSPPAVETSAGTIIGTRYRLVQAVGSGTFGEVYLATHLVTGGKVAIKLLRPERIASEQAQRRFSFEARAMHGLHHPNTVRVMDVGVENDGRPWIAMEWIEGRTLADVVAHEGALPLERAFSIARQLLGSLAEAHAARLVHRDVKPQNLMLLNVRGGRGEDHLKVLDFGIARDVDSDAPMTAHPIGTPGYMAPEMWLGATATPAADVYSAGCVLYHMITGESLREVYRDEVAATPEAIREVAVRVQERLTARGVPAAVAAVVGRMVAPGRSERPVDAGHALTALDEAMRSAPRAPQTHRRTLIQAGLFGVGAVLVTLLGLALAQDNAERRHEAAESTSRALDAHLRTVSLDVVDPSEVVEGILAKQRAGLEADRGASSSRLTDDDPNVLMPDVSTQDAGAGKVLRPEMEAEQADSGPGPKVAVVSARLPAAVKLQISPTTARISIDGGPFVPPPPELAAPPPDRPLRLVARATGHETLRLTLDAEAVAKLEDGRLALTMKRRVAKPEAPRLDLEGLEIPTPSAPRSTR